MILTVAKSSRNNLDTCINTNPNKFSLLPSPKGEGQDEGIHITTFWDWYYTKASPACHLFSEILYLFGSSSCSLYVLSNFTKTANITLSSLFLASLCGNCHNAPI
jgi:hypothetical protein